MSGKKDVDAVVKEKADNIFTAIVDYTRSLKGMIQAGKYDWVNDDITAKHFPVKGSGKMEVVFEPMHFNRSISSDNAIAEIKQKGRRPAKIEELLAFGEKYPEEQRKFPIVGLGSVCQLWRGYRIVPYLDGCDGWRSLGLGWCGHDWDDDYRFLAVRES